MTKRIQKSSLHGFSDVAFEVSRAKPVQAKRLAELVERLDNPASMPSDIDNLLENTDILIIEGFVDRRAAVDQVLVPAVYVLEEPHRVYDLLLFMQTAIFRLAKDGHAFGNHPADPLLFQSMAHGLAKIRTDNYWRKKSAKLAGDLMETLSPQRGHDAALVGSLRTPGRGLRKSTGSALPVHRFH